MHEFDVDELTEDSSLRLYVGISRLRQCAIGISNRRVDAPFGRTYSFLIATRSLLVQRKARDSARRPHGDFGWPPDRLPL
jgi:hypothetical protein